MHCKEAEMAARREEDKRVEEELEAARRRCVTLHGSALLELWASLDITGPHCYKMLSNMSQHIHNLTR